MTRNLDVLNKTLYTQGRNSGLPNFLHHVGSAQQHQELQDIIRMDGCSNSTIRALAGLSWGQLHERVYKQFKHAAVSPHAVGVKRRTHTQQTNPQRRRTDYPAHKRTEAVNRSTNPMTSNPNSHVVGQKRALDVEREALRRDNKAMQRELRDRRKPKPNMDTLPKRYWFLNGLYTDNVSDIRILKDQEAMFFHMYGRQPSQEDMTKWANSRGILMNPEKPLSHEEMSQWASDNGLQPPIQAPKPPVPAPKLPIDSEEGQTLAYPSWLVPLIVFNTCVSLLALAIVALN